MKRLTIELSVEQYELLRTEALATRSSLVGVIRGLIEERRSGLPTEERRSYKEDPLYARRGSFKGPPGRVRYEGYHLYGRRP